MEKDKKKGLTEGVIWKQILFFFLPILIGTFFQQLYNTVDAIIVGQFAGKEALSSVGGSSGQIINLLVGFFVALTGGCSVIISQFYGAREQKGLERALHTSYALAVTGGIGLGIIGFLGAPMMLRIMDTPADLMKDSTLYIRMYFAGLIFVFIYNMGSSVLRAIGDSKRPLYYLIICCVINIVLDLTFVLALGLGVMGVALATLIAQAVSAVMVTLHLMKGVPEFKLDLRLIRFYPGITGKMLRIGLPNGIQSVMYSVSNIIVQTAINGFGVDTVAAWTSLGKIDSLFWMLNGAMSTSCITFVGQNYGAGKKDRIKKGIWVCLFMEIILGGLLSTAIIVFGSQLFGIFTGDAAVVAIGLRMIRVISPFYGVFAIIEILSSSLRAEGHVLIPTVVVLLCVCVFRVIWTTILVAGKSMELIVACYPVSWAIAAVVMICYFIPKQKKVMSTFR